MSLKYYFFVNLIFFISCTTAPDFERSKTSDPDSENYLPPTPVFINTPFFDENEHIIVTWDENSIFTTGYEVFKYLEPEIKSASYVGLSKDEFMVIDSTKRYSKDSYYEVFATKDSLRSVPRKLNINFGRIDFLELSDLPTPKIILVEWVNSIKISSQTIIEYRIDGDDWATADTVDTSLEEFSFDYSAFTTSRIDFRVTGIFEDYKGETSLINTQLRSINLN